MNKNSNTYIIIYSVVMVVIVAVLLAVASLSLQDRQNANRLNEKKQSILTSLEATDRAYEGYISEYAIDAEGNKIEGIDVFKQMEDLKGSFEDGIYPLFEAQDGRIVVPVIGTGLWGPVWGYVALEKDMNTIVGVVMDHSGETPGLGAEISTPKHCALYKGKQIFEGDEFVSVKLRKGGATQENFAHEVDAISGGTKTSDGVSAMLENSLRNYLPFFVAKRTVAENENGEVSNEVKSESNE